MKHTEIETIEDFSNYLRCDLAFIKKAIDEEFSIRETKNLESTSNTITIPLNEITVSRYYIKKKGKKGGFRVVHQAWAYKLENSLKILNNYLNEIYKPQNYIHGFVKGKNIKTNAQQHLEKKIILSVDIKNYFETITSKMIIDALIKLGYSKEVSTWIASITTINGHLVQGFCTSPTIANIVTQDLDKQLKKISGKEIEYTRYADDLYFSSNGAEISLEKITEAVVNFGFTLNEDKTKFMPRGQQQFVTGLTTFDSQIPRISKKRKKNIRLEIYFLNKYGYQSHIKNKLRKAGEDFKHPDFKYKVLNEIENTRNKLYGWLHFIKSIEPEFSAKYYPRLQKARK
jgi:RNA-directed DNA polymerase